MITSVHNPKIQQARILLGRAKNRRQENAFVVEGVRLVEEAAQAGWLFRFGFYTEELSLRGKDIVARMQAERGQWELASPTVLKSISATETSQGILAVVERSALPVPQDLTFALVLDSIRDPGNLGTLLRSAAAAGAEAVFLLPSTADAFAPKVIRSGMGAHFHMPILECSWEEIRARLKGLKVFIAEMEAPLSCWQADFRPPLALVIGGEADGVSPAALALPHQAVAISMQGTAESLNAAVAGGILMFEVVRQRRAGS